MNVTLKQLQIFVDSARNKSMSIAADKNSVTQPAASRSISMLEDSLNVMLFDRTMGKPLRLTNIGKDLFIRALNILEKVENIEKDLNMEELVTGKIVMGASLYISDYLLPEILTKFQEKYPLVEIDFIRASSAEVLESIEDSIFDIGFIEGGMFNEDIDSTFWQNDKLVYIVSTNNPLSQKKDITIDDIFNCNWVVREDETGERDFCFDKKHQDKLYSYLHIEIKKVEDKLLIKDSSFGGMDSTQAIIGKDMGKNKISLDSTKAIKTYVANSMSLACVSEKALSSTPAKEGLVVLNDIGIDITRKLNIIKNRNKDDSSVVTLFLDYVLGMIK